MIGERVRATFEDEIGRLWICFESGPAICHGAGMLRVVDAEETEAKIAEQREKIGKRLAELGSPK